MKALLIAISIMLSIPLFIIGFIYALCSSSFQDGVVFHRMFYEWFHKKATRPKFSKPQHSKTEIVIHFLLAGCLGVGIAFGIADPLFEYIRTMRFF